MKRPSFEEWERICRLELRELYDCLHDTEPQRAATPYGPWARAKFALAGGKAAHGEQGDAEEQDSDPEREAGKPRRSNGRKRRKKNEDDEKIHASDSAWEKELAVVVFS